MNYKFDIGDRVMGIKNTPIEDCEEVGGEENIIDEIGTVVGTMSGDSENIYVVTFDNEINKHNCVFPGSRKNRTAILYEYQIKKLGR